MNHTPLSLGGNIPKYEYSNTDRAKFYDKAQYGQTGTGFWASVIGGVSGAIGGIVGSIGGPLGSGALASAAGYEGKKIAEQYGLGYQYKSEQNVGLWTTPNSLGAVSMYTPNLL